jgi:ribosome-associated translation inhibitor RaiA
MSSPTASSADNTAVVPIIIDGRNIEVTPALEEYVNKRIGGTLNKLSSNGAIRECDVILSVSKNPKVSQQKGAPIKKRSGDTDCSCTHGRSSFFGLSVYRV